MKTKKKIIPPIVPKKIPPPAHYNSSPNFSFLLAHNSRDPVSMGTNGSSPPMFFKVEGVCNHTVLQYFL